MHLKKSLLRRQVLRVSVLPDIGGILNEGPVQDPPLIRGAVLFFGTNTGPDLDNCQYLVAGFPTSVH